MEFFNYFLDLFQVNLKFIIPFYLLFVIDFICGVSKGIFIEGISSHKLRMSVPKFIGYTGLIFMTLVIDSLLILSMSINNSYVTSGALIACSVVEMKSISENLKTLGIDIPQIVTDGINQLKKEDKENER